MHTPTDALKARVLFKDLRKVCHSDEEFSKWQNWYRQAGQELKKSQLDDEEDNMTIIEWVFALVKFTTDCQHVTECWGVHGKSWKKHEW